MGDWLEVQLGECARFQEGYVNPSQSVGRYFDGPVKWLRAVDLNDTYVVSTSRTLSEDGFRSAGKSAKLFAPGTLAISKSGTIGRLGILKDYMCGNRAVINIVPDTSVCDPTFLFFLLRNKRAVIETLAEGSVQRNLYVPLLANFKVQLPPLEQQRDIGEALGSLDDKIELNRRMNETLEAMAQAIFRDWFVDFGPTRRKLEGATDPENIIGGLFTDTERAQALADLFPANLDGDELPTAWEPATLDAYALLNSESWGAKTSPPEVEYVDLANTKWGTIESTALYTWEAAPSRARRIIRRGDTIVGTVRPGNGSYAFVGRDGLTASTGFAVLRPRRAAFAEFVNCAVTSVENVERLEKLADGGAYPAVRPEVVLATAVPLVPEELALAFHDLVAPIFQRIELSKEENTTLSATRDLLLPTLMSGEIRLRDAEEALEAAQ